MCIECIITWIAVPVGTAWAIYYWIIQACIKYHKNMCVSYDKIVAQHDSTVMKLDYMEEFKEGVKSDINRELDKADTRICSVESKLVGVNKRFSTTDVQLNRELAKFDSRLNDLEELNGSSI